MTFLVATHLALLLFSPGTPAFAQSPVSYDENVKTLQTQAKSAREKGDFAEATRIYLDLHILVRDKHGPRQDRAISILSTAVEMALKIPEGQYLCELKGRLAAAAAAVATTHKKIESLEQKIDAALTEKKLTCPVPDNTSPGTKPSSTASRDLPAEKPKHDQEPAPTFSTGSRPDATDSRPDSTGSRPDSTDTVPTPAPEAPAPLPRLAVDRPRKLKIGGYTSLGVFGGTGLALIFTGLALGNRAEREGQAMADAGSSAQQIQDTSVGQLKTANALVFAGPIIAATGLVAAVVLLSAAHRARPRSPGIAFHF